MKQGIERLNHLSRGEAEAELLKCCGSKAWARFLAARRPFREVDELLRAADEVWWNLGEDDWREAFDRHPKIGERKSAAAQTQEEKSWSAQEQSGMDAAGASVRAELAAGNREYERRFGHIFIVCAKDKTPEEMLRLLRTRLMNDPATELRAAAEEQRRITRLRLQKLLET